MIMLIIGPISEKPVVIIVGLLMLVSSCGTAGALTGTGVVAGPSIIDNEYRSIESVDGANASRNQTGTGAPNEASEERYLQTVPEKGDPYFEAAASDGSWVSYQNPRDEYRNPYLGDGSAKMCVTLRNEAGETIVGKTVPNTTVTIPTGDTLDWHSAADPITVNLPLTQHSSRPLDADQFGTSDKLPQGDGYLDSHCFEFHGLSEDSTVEYGEVELNGEHTDAINVVGYVQQEHEAWDSNIDPITAAESYEKGGGGWTYQPGASHGQVVVILQLDSSESDNQKKSTKETTEIDDEMNEPTTDTRNEEPATDTKSSESTESDIDETEFDEVPSFGMLVALVGLLIIVAVWNRRHSPPP